jgi:hypothetical protein
MGPLGTGIFFFYLKQSSNVLYDYNKKFTVYVTLYIHETNIIGDSGKSVVFIQNTHNHFHQYS